VTAPSGVGWRRPLPTERAVPRLADDVETRLRAPGPRPAHQRQRGHAGDAGRGSARGGWRR
jgi:hypothetical protein